MPEGLTGDPPAESVTHRWIIGCRMSDQRHSSRLVAQESPVVPGRVPLREIVYRRINPTVTEHGTREALVLSCPFTVRHRVAERTIADSGDPFFMRDCVVHPEWSEDATGEKIREGPA